MPMEVKPIKGKFNPHSTLSTDVPVISRKSFTPPKTQLSNFMFFQGASKPVGKLTPQQRRIKQTKRG